MTKRYMNIERKHENNWSINLYYYTDKRVLLQWQIYAIDFIWEILYIILIYLDYIRWYGTP
jgi:hypothetical protein